MPLAILIPVIAAGASAAATVYAANKTAGAARDAANTQTAAGNKALDLQREQWQQQQANQKPYMNMGTKALSRLEQRIDNPRPPMPMFNGNQQGGGWTQDNYAQQWYPPPNGPQPMMGQMFPAPPNGEPPSQNPYLPSPNAPASMPSLYSMGTPQPSYGTLYQMSRGMPLPPSPPRTLPRFS